jgi:adenosine deaminase
MVCACLREPEDFRRIAYEFCEDEAAEGVRYAEVTFSLPEHGFNWGDWDTPVAAVLDGFAAGGRACGVTCRLIIDAVRNFPLDGAERAMRVALRYRDAGVVALGLGGSEKDPPEPFAEIFRAARDGGLHSVPHAGETAGAESIRGAVYALGAERIGHGIRVLEDPVLVEDLRARELPLEVCLTSNVASGVVRRIEDHPFPRLLAAGLVVTLNSDDPSMFRSPLAGEYALARTVFGLDDVALAERARCGVRASFAEETRKNTLLAEIDHWLVGGFGDDPARGSGDRLPS